MEITAVGGTIMTVSMTDLETLYAGALAEIEALKKEVERLKIEVRIRTETFALAGILGKGR